MPILRTDIFEGAVQSEALRLSPGRRWFPTNDLQMRRVNERWCNQCKRLFDCGIKAKVDMILGLHNNDFQSIIADLLVELATDGVDLRPTEWRVDANGKPKCNAMEAM